jgi:hypothetical protein
MGAAFIYMQQSAIILYGRWKPHHFHRIILRPNTTMPVISPLAADKLRNAEYQRFVETHYYVNSDKTTPTTRLSSKFDKQQKLHETSSRLKDGTEILKDVLTLITDDIASKKKKLDAARIIEQSILPLMSAAAGVAKESANAVGVSILHFYI